MKLLIPCALVMTTVVAATAPAEPEPRKPVQLPLQVAGTFPEISGVLELPDGRLLISDARTPRVSVVATDTGAATIVGAPGAGPGQYARPGGLYGTAATGFWLLDRGMSRAVAVSPSGTLGESHSVLRRGTSGASDADYDSQRVDARGRSYFLDRDGILFPGSTGTSAPMLDLIRLDPASQRSAVVARLQHQVTRTRAGGDGMTFSQHVIGSPADGWGVAADGRVAVVRAAPYRVDWYSLGGEETKGPVYEVDAIPMTEADKQAFIAASGAVSVGLSGAAQSAASATGPFFADTKAPFDPNYIQVSPQGRAFVPRSRSAGAPEVIYDVFDGQGRRVDRLLLPGGSRIVGFGAAAIYVREAAASGAAALKKYEVK
jgi:hypothetical protein